MGRSGSTLLCRLLGQAHGVCSVGELCYVWDQGVLNNRTCGCGLPFADCPFWTEVGATSFGGWHQMDAARALALRRSVERTRFVPALATGCATQSFKERHREYTGLMAQVYRGIRDVSGCDVVLDASKYPSSAYLAFRNPEVDLRLLHLVRTSPGVAYSWSKVVARPDRDGKPLARFSPTRSAVDWNVYNALVEGLRPLGAAYRRLRYEDFVAAPAAVIEDVLDFLEVPRSTLDFVHGQDVELHQTHTVAGNPMRFRQGAEKVRRDDEWSSEMEPRVRRIVTGLTLPALLRYGYGADGTYRA